MAIDNTVTYLKCKVTETVLYITDFPSSTQGNLVKYVGIEDDHEANSHGKGWKLLAINFFNCFSMKDRNDRAGPFFNRLLVLVHESFWRF